MTRYHSVSHSPKYAEASVTKMASARKEKLVRKFMESQTGTSSLPITRGRSCLPWCLR